MDCRNCENTKCFIKKHCLPDWLDYVQKTKTISHLSSDKKIFSEGDLVQGIYIVCAGKVKLNMKIDKDHEDILRLAGDGQILGHRGFYEDMTYPVSAVTIVPSEIAFLSNEDFIRLLRKNTDLSLFLIMFYASELLHSDRKLKLNMQKSPRQKTLFALQRLYKAFGVESGRNLWIKPGMDLDDLANFATLSPEDFIEALDELKAESILELDGDRINILDQESFLVQI